MMMTLDEAINYYSQAENFSQYGNHGPQQIVGWLKELRELRKMRVKMKSSIDNIDKSMIVFGYHLGDLLYLAEKWENETGKDVCGLGEAYAQGYQDGRVAHLQDYSRQASQVQLTYQSYVQRERDMMYNKKF